MESIRTTEVPNISYHAKDRIRERCGLPKKSVERNAMLALQKGLTHNEATGRLKKYFDWLYFQNRNGNNIRVYNNHVYIFKGTALITVLPLPHVYRSAVQKLLNRCKANQERIKEEV